jgi:thymidylate kinase
MTSASSQGASAILNRLIAVLNESGLQYCILHGYSGFPDRVTSDVDCLVPGGTLPGALAGLLARNRERLGATVVQWLQHEATAHYFVLAASDGQSAPEFLAFDASTDYRARGRTFYTGEQIMSKRRRQDTFWVPTESLEFGYYLVKRVGKGSLNEEHARRLSELYARDPGGCDREIERFWGPAAAAVVTSAAARGDWQRVMVGLPMLQTELLTPRGAAGIGNRGRYWLREALRRLRRWVAPSGAFIVLLGADGAGKSTVSAALRHNLRPAFRKTSGAHFGPDLLGRARRRGPDGSTTPHAQVPRTFAASVAKCLLWLFDYTIGYHVAVRPALVRSTLVVFDRYLLDALVDARRYRYGGPRWLLRLVWRLVPKPDLVVLLDAPAAVLHARKPEVAFEESVRQREEYRVLVAGLPYGHIVDADRPPDAVVAEVQQIVLSYLGDRAGLRLGTTP